MIVFYAIYAVVTITITVTVFLTLRRFGRGKALTAAFATALLSGLLFPIPIHGGFTIALEELISNYRSDQRLKQYENTRVQKSRFLNTLVDRFKGNLPYLERKKVSENWTLVETDLGTKGWLDLKSGLIWSEPLIWNGSSRPTLEEAKAFCRNYEPGGYWALPTAGERVLFWQNGGEAISPTGRMGTIAPIMDTKLQMELPQINLGNGIGFAIRCVARSERAPSGGYSKEDIPLEIWNHYQFEMLAGGP